MLKSNLRDLLNEFMEDTAIDRMEEISKGPLKGGLIEHPPTFPDFINWLNK